MRGSNPSESIDYAIWSGAGQWRQWTHPPNWTWWYSVVLILLCIYHNTHQRFFHILIILGILALSDISASLKAEGTASNLLHHVLLGGRSCRNRVTITNSRVLKGICSCGHNSHYQTQVVSYTLPQCGPVQPLWDIRRATQQHMHTVWNQQCIKYCWPLVKTVALVNDKSFQTSTVNFNGKHFTLFFWW